MQMTQNKNEENILNDAFRSIKGYFLYAVLFSASVNILMLTPVIYMLQVFDRVVSSGSMSTLMMLTLLMLLLLSSAGSFEGVRSRLLVAANVRLESALRDPLSKAAFTRALVTGSPNGASQVMSDLLGLRQFITGNGAFAVMDAPWTLFYIGIMFLFHPMFGIAAIISAVIMILLAVITQKATSEKLLRANQLTNTANISFRSNLRNAEVIHGMGMAANIRKRDSLLFDAASDEQAVASTIAGRLAAISKSFRMISQSILLGMGAYLALNGEISPGLMIGGSLLLGRALAPIDMMVGNWKGFVEVKSQFNRIRDALAAFPAENDRMNLPAPSGSLSVENIILIPPGAQVASVKGVGFQLAAGDALGLIGPSAAGKTSLARAILGVWPLRAGTVRLDGAEISQWDRNDLGPYLGYLPQDIELFDGSIADNICRFSQQDSEKIIEASQTAGIHEMILHLPEGYDTLLNSNAGALSAGQRQRVGLARAIYGQPKLVILDEPNSNLDDQGERDLLAALQRLKESGRTVIVITHRTSILSMVDKLLVLKDGSVMKFGDKDEVLKAMSTANPKIAQLQNKA